jgi:hypothetical protein
MTKSEALAIVSAPASAEVRAATARRFIAGKSAHALLALIGSGVPLPHNLTAQDIGAADAARTADKAAARTTAAA